MIMTSQHSQPHLQPISESQCKENETEKSNSIMDDAEILKIDLDFGIESCFWKRLAGKKPVGRPTKRYKARQDKNAI